MKKEINQVSEKFENLNSKVIEDQKMTSDTITGLERMLKLSEATCSFEINISKEEISRNVEQLVGSVAERV